MKRRDWTVVRTSTVVNEDTCLPRPKIVNQVIMIAPREVCEEAIERLSQMQEHQSTLDIEVVIKAIPYNGQKSNTSARPGNGRN